MSYEGGKAQMIVLLPDQERFDEIEGLLGIGMMDNVLRTSAWTNLKLFMPRFEFKSSLDLADTLKKMGMQDAFVERKADFTGIAGNPLHPLNIDEVFHKAFVAVDEMGTEAAAATVVATGEAVAALVPTKAPIVVRIDRPFIFIIRDTVHDTVLFVGRVLDPTK